MSKSKLQDAGEWAVLGFLAFVGVIGTVLTVVGAFVFLLAFSGACWALAIYGVWAFAAWAGAVSMAPTVYLAAVAGLVVTLLRTILK